MKKWTKIVLTTVMLLAVMLLLPLGTNSADAATPASGTWGNLSWTLDSSGTLTISGRGEMKAFTDVGEWGNKIILSDAWLAYQDQITAVVIHDGVTSIGDDAFHNCENMTGLTIPESVTSIGEEAFIRCDSLTNVIIPSGVTKIGMSAFRMCHGLTEISLPSGLASIGSSAFRECSSLSSIVIPDTVTRIGSYAFYHCDSMKDITLSTHITSIESGTFWGCSALKSMSVPSGVTAILEHAFYHSGFTCISIPSSVKNIYQNAFMECENLTDVYYGGTQSQWNAISVDYNYNKSLASANIHYTGTAQSYSVSYNANGGTGTPSSQTKEQDAPLTLSGIKPSKSYVIQYNANGGSVSPASKNVACTFKSWNTKQDGSGTSYAPGGTYTSNSDITLYAQWTNPTAGTLATPSRSGYTFAGWFSSAAGGEQIKDSSTVTGNMTVYAHWSAPVVSDPYNIGDETYSFANYSDSDSPGGHCFGMSITSACYHNGFLDIGKIGGNANTPLYSFGPTQIVKRPICYYQGIQGWRSTNATVAGGSFYLYHHNNMALDWQEVVSYVRSHDYDGTGLLQIGFRKDGEGGHAINFLRYESVNGQDRIYAYDNNFPTQETYFYRDSSGSVRQAPVQTFSGAIDCIALRDIRTYFNTVGDFDVSHVLYMAKDAAAVQGYSYSYMDGDFGAEEYVMYEIPADQSRVVIVPNRDYADFIYMDTEYSFGKITDETRGELKLATMNEGAVVSEASFRIFEADSVFGEPDFVLPSALKEIDSSAFEGIAATTVYVPDSCVSIGAYAFRNAAVKQIRIPAQCSIADTAFDGCAKVTIFGTPGSPAEAFCGSHKNCTFVAENG